MKRRSVLGLDVRGAIGKSVIASSWRGHDYLKEYVVPHNPRSDLQEQQRGFLRDGARAWRALDRAQKQLYGRLATEVTGYNLFLSRYILAVRAAQAPEIPIVLQWRREGERAEETRLAVRKGDRVLFEFDLKASEGEFALTGSDAPYMVELRHGAERWLWEISTLEKGSMSQVGEAGGMRVEMHG